MEVVPFRTPGLGDTSYLLTHDGTGVLVDPQRDIDRFLDAAAERDVALRFVVDTHLHNDYVSGAEQAALRTGAELVLPAAAAPAYPHTPAFHMEDIKGDKGLTLRPIHTPGHTPEHTSYLVLIDGEPVAVFSGGSMLVAAAGRPDLLGPERAGTLARLQYRSLHRLAELPRDVLLLPTHGEGSFCTVTGAGRHTSTIGEEIDTNPLLSLPSADEFAEELMGAPQPIPAFYQYMGPANVRGVPPMPAVDVPVLKAADLAGLPEETQVVDIRPRATMAAGFVPGSTGIELADDFGSWTGWLLPYGAPIALVAEPGQDVAAAVTQLAQIGIDGVVGVVTDLTGVQTASFQVADLGTVAELARRPDAQVLDVRMPSEHEAVALPGAAWRFLPDLFTEGVPAELDPGRPVLVACGSGRRAAIAATALHRAGFTPVVLTGAGVAELAAALPDPGDE
jgi:glyoxylase-like metal-dependent hydrolase (beta-lactamase superfamily II)/rhodanese-related sulfurtransferase